MARKEETVSMIDTLAEFKELKNIDKDTMISVLEESFRNVIAKMFGTDENYDVIINPEKGDFGRFAGAGFFPGCQYSSFLFRIQPCGYEGGKSLLCAF